MSITIHSGGAQGADSYFGNIGIELGYKVIHHSFMNHRVNCKGTVLVHNLFQLFLADAYLQKANKSLHRAFPPRSVFVKRLLQRNYYQVKDSSCIVAVSKLDKNMKLVCGGTGWACQLGVDMGKPVYVFDDGQTNEWYIYDYDQQIFAKLSSIPIISDSLAGIGTREITPAGIQAIRGVLTSSSSTDLKLKFWTAQYRYSGEDRFDITVKGAVNYAFAPTWNMVNAYKNGSMTEEQYTVEYRALMKKSIGTNKKAWEELLALKEATLVCFCPSNTFCHRHILADILKQLGAHYMGERSVASKNIK